MRQGPVALVLGLMLALGGAPAVGDGEGVPAPSDDYVVVPVLSYRTPQEAAAMLARSGLTLQRVFERRYPQPYKLGTVVQQRPMPGTHAAWGSKVDVLVMAEQDGPSEGRAADLDWPKAPPRASLVPPPAPDPAAVPAPIPEPAGTPVPPPAPEPGPVPLPTPTPGPESSAPEQPPPAGWPPPEPVRPAPPTLPAGSGFPTTAPSGSPDAPAVGVRAVPGTVPDLKGLTLVDAEQRAREAEVVLYVERVPGHPVGRVVTQVPDAGAARPKGSVVQVTVTAGGDREGERVPVPSVEVTRVAVPDLLDRSPLQAQRILEDLGLSMRREEAKSGLPGRVVDQHPASGAETAKGSVVTVWIGPGEVARPALPPPPGPSTPPPTPASSTSPPPGALAGVPAPIAPAEGTLLPKTRTLALGFSWLPVEGADAYVLEVEEGGPAGWLPSVRKAARTSATTLELERVAPTAAEVRWRVRALSAGREGAPSAWVTLR